MAGLQRSTTSFRRQGSSGLVWDDKLLSGELTKHGNQGKQLKDEGLMKKASSRTGVDGSLDRTRSNGGGRNYRSGRISPAIEPPSPKLSACGFCGAFCKQENARRRPPKSGKRMI